MHAFRPNTERVQVFQSAGNLVPIGIPAESGWNVPPRLDRALVLLPGKLSIGSICLSLGRPGASRPLWWAWGKDERCGGATAIMEEPRRASLAAMVVVHRVV